MMFTDLAYQEIGTLVATTLTFVFVFAIIYRFIMSFIHYINHGNFGNVEKSFFISMVDTRWNDAVKYAFTGYHPGMILVDAFILSLYSLVMVALWAPMIVLLLLLLLGHTMRKRIGTKQEFIAKLDGTHNDG